MFIDKGKLKGKKRMIINCRILENISTHQGQIRILSSNDRFRFVLRLICKYVNINIL